jgi:hypothetical protein
MSAPTRSDHLVLGAATSYELPEIMPFVRSLRRTGYAGHLALLVDALRPESCHALQGMGVELVTIANRWQTLSGHGQRLRRHAARLQLPALWYAASLGWAVRDPVRRRLRRNRSVVSCHHISSARYFHYYEYLVRQPARFERVMLTDVRDVLFQDDPFAFSLPQPLLFFLEGSGQRIGMERYNRNWVRQLYGRRGLRSLADQRIVCSGTTIGDARAILRYLELMCDELARLTGRICGRVSRDQGVHNGLIGRNCFPEAALLENGCGPVLTMGIEAFERFRTAPNGALLNDDGSRVAVVHQYDRHEGCAEQLLRQLAGP